MMMKYAWIFLLFFSVAVFADKPEKGWSFSQGLGGSYNGLGVILDTSVFYTIPLSDSTNILWETMKFEIGVDNSLTPTDERLSLYMNIEPIAIFDLGVNIGFIGMYKLFGFGFTDVGNYRSLLSDAVVLDLPQDDKGGLFLQLSPEFKVQFGPVILVDCLDYIYMNVGDDDSYYNNRNEGIVLKYADNFYINNIYAIYDFSNGFYAGMNYNDQWNPTTALGTRYIAVLGAYEWKLNPHSKLSFNLLLGRYLYDGYDQFEKDIPYIAAQATYDLKL
jgi:hypothetical protein